MQIELSEAEVQELFLSLALREYKLQDTATFFFQQGADDLGRQTRDLQEAVGKLRWGIVRQFNERKWEFPATQPADQENDNN